VSRSRLAAALAAGFAAVALAGCARHDAAGTDTGTDRFIAGDGIATYVPAARRGAGPTLSGTTLDGASLDVTSLRGGVVVVNVWGSWCAPCKAEQPALERVAQATRSRGVHFVGVDIREPGRTPAQRHVARFAVSYPSLWDPSAKLLTRFAVVPKATPSTYLLDPDGRIAAYVFGPVDEASLTDLLDRVLAEPVS
jgi:thiol-disulfide isomerase/thioredoxin